MNINPISEAGFRDRLPAVASGRSPHRARLGRMITIAATPEVGLMANRIPNAAHTAVAMNTLLSPSTAAAISAPVDVASAAAHVRLPPGRGPACSGRSLRRSEAGTYT